MSSGPVDGAGGAAPRGWSRLSITARFALLCALATLLLLAAATAVLHWAVTSNLELDDLHYLRAKIQVLRLAVRDLPRDAVILRHEVEEEGGIFDPHQFAVFYSRVLDEAGRLMIETPGMSSIIPESKFPPPEAAGALPREMLDWESPQGRSYWLMSAMAESGGKPALIQIALDDTEEVTLLRHYRRASLAVVLIGTLVAAVIGVLVARHSLRPLREIAQTTERITASHLNERVDPGRWPEELADLARSFDLMLARLDDSFRRLSQFSADLAHELRTPIHNLRGETEVALSRERKPAEYRELLQSNLEELDRLTRMINGLLFLARAENPATHIERLSLDARAELEAVREFHEALAEEAGVSLTCEGEGQIHADPVLFRRAVTNLVSNALRHSPRGGEVRLSVRQEDEGAAVVAVSDTGCGIAPEHLPRIFDRFYRPDRPGHHNPDGTGLGLAIVRSIMELHGGSAGIDSTPGKGTVVTLRFPSSTSGTGAVLTSSSHSLEPGTGVSESLRSRGSPAAEGLQSASGGSAGP
jgi:two-component system heavy metal sensor histidine kinase CusS